jgi:WhiB family redox-sensing transcriptional regulator
MATDLSETFQHPWHAGTFGESARDVDLALTLALTETLAFRDLIRPTGSPPELTPVLLAPTFDARSPILMSWRDRAACLGVDPEPFFPIGNTGTALLQIEEAKVVCRRCEVVEPCLSWAVESRQEEGVWGGLSADERRAVKRRNARARRADPSAPGL